MSVKTRIHRPTTSTSRKPLRGRMIHQSTFYGPVKMPDGTTPVMKLGKGSTRKVS